ncbi:MAG: sel1 repeat family protein, partial [Brachymonas sp.]|nr:sel1 repeat family protein [Brachymonas sp.]
WGAPKNYSEALRWFRRSAKHGHTLAAAMLGEIYRLGLGTARDDRSLAFNAPAFAIVAAPADGSDKPAEAGAAEVKTTVKRVRKVTAPASTDGGQA